MTKWRYSAKGAEAFNHAYTYCLIHNNEFVLPEHLLLAMLDQEECVKIFSDLKYDHVALRQKLSDYIEGLEKVPASFNYTPVYSLQLRQLCRLAHHITKESEAENISVCYMMAAISGLEESYALCFLQEVAGEDLTTLIVGLIGIYEDDSNYSASSNAFIDELEYLMDDEEEEEDNYDIEPFDAEEYERLTGMFSPEGQEESLVLKAPYLSCLNQTYMNHNPLIGREAELERTIQILCRKDKNNVLYVGEPGVGKTAVIYGLAAMIERGDVPERLKGCQIYQLDLAALLAGTQYRGDFEKRITEVMNTMEKLDNVIVYIDEIHNLVGIGSIGENSMDASNILKPYLESGKIRFIGSTTYAEYNRYFAKSMGIVRRFRQIDIAEPTIEQAVEIVNGLKEKYEEFHHVTYLPGVIDFTVRSSAKLISNRFLPDKAIDLIDEAGAYRQLHPQDSAGQTVDEKLINEILAKVCKINAEAMKEESNETLKTLLPRIKSRIYGQDKAVDAVVEAVQMAKAGLMDDNKPLASLLFVGPTGVGKTEVARVLAQELGIELVRFDMSEYAEKHAVAKLIGSPAGYVGYEDGGLLTDAIRKSPNCVLLLDEIEKAHHDIYNILLQVMDYAKLTDNKGQKADFRNVVLIMTSNAGAQYASQAAVGFAGNVSRGEAMLQQVKKTFKPEFINRLSSIVVFRDMDRPMAQLIMQKKLGELHAKLVAQKIELTLAPEVEELLLERGFTPQYGAREMDRVIAGLLKPLLTREILYGELRKGGKARVEKAKKEGDELVVKVIG